MQSIFKSRNDRLLSTLSNQEVGKSIDLGERTNERERERRTMETSGQQRHLYLSLIAEKNELSLFRQKSDGIDRRGFSIGRSARKCEEENVERNRRVR